MCKDSAGTARPSHLTFRTITAAPRAQVVKRRLVVSEVEAAEGGEEGDAQVEVLGEGSVLQRVFTLQARPAHGAPCLPMCS